MYETNFREIEGGTKIVRECSLKSENVLQKTIPNIIVLFAYLGLHAASTDWEEKNFGLSMSSKKGKLLLL